MAYMERVSVADPAGDEMGSFALELDDDEEMVHVTMAAEDGEVLLSLDLAEAEQLLAKLATKIAQARMRG